MNEQPSASNNAGSPLKTVTGVVLIRIVDGDIDASSIMSEEEATKAIAAIGYPENDFVLKIPVKVELDMLDACLKLGELIHSKAAAFEESQQFKAKRGLN